MRYDQARAGSNRGLEGDAGGRQETAARAIINYGTDDDELQLTDEQVAEIGRRVANPNRKFISLNELDKRLRQLGV
jgi:hypothetical protein